MLLADFCFQPVFLLLARVQLLPRFLQRQQRLVALAFEGTQLTLQVVEQLRAAFHFARKAAGLVHAQPGFFGRTLGLAPRRFEVLGQREVQRTHLHQLGLQRADPLDGQHAGFGDGVGQRLRARILAHRFEALL